MFFLQLTLSHLGQRQAVHRTCVCYTNLPPCRAKVTGNYFTYEVGPRPWISALKRSMRFHSLITHFVNMFLVGLYAAVIASVE